jgi:hypothetical protein
MRTTPQDRHRGSGEPDPQPVRKRDAQRPIRRLVAPDKEHDPSDAHHDVGQPGGKPGRHQLALGQRWPEVHRDVVGEDHDQAEGETAERTVASVGRAERNADEAEHQAGHGDRPFPVDGDELLMGDSPRRSMSATRARSSAIVSSFGPRSSAAFLKTVVGSRVTKMRANWATSYRPSAFEV